MRSNKGRTLRIDRLVGRVIEGDYPRHNFKGVPTAYEHRRALVLSVRDVEAIPLEAETVAANPLQRRGRYLIEAYDIDKDEGRHFYLESFRQLRSRTPKQSLAKGRRPIAVIVVERGDWKADNPDDVPPSVELYPQANHSTAEVFVREFNRAEMNDADGGSGRWAVRCRV